jgi:hypothetical protein
MRICYLIHIFLSKNVKLFRKGTEALGSNKSKMYMKFQIVEKSDLEKDSFI